MDPTTAKTPLALLVAALLTVPLTSDAERPVSGQDASRLPDTYQIMVGRDVPEASGELQHLKDVTVAPDGTVYLLDQGSDPWRVPPRVLRLSSTGRLIGAWSNLSAPVSVGVAPGGTVLVVDEAGRRLQRFTPWGTFVDARSLEVHTDSPCHATDAVNALAVGVDGRLYLAAGDRIQVRDADASCVTAWEASDTPKDLAVDSDGLVYASLYDHSKIEVFDPTGRRVLSFGRTGDGPGEFGECEVWSGPYFSHMEPCGPHGLAVATDGTLLAADYGNDRVQRFSRDGDYRGHWPTGSGTVAAPTHLAVGADGTVFVASHRGGLSAYTQDGTRIAVRGAGAPPSRAVRAPRSIDIGPSGDILVADTGNHRIQRMDADGQFLGTWGTLGWGPGELSSPQGVAVAPDGTVVVSDTRNRRLQRFDSDGALVDVLTPTIEGRDVFSRPLGVDVAASGDIYVADAGRDRVIWLGADGSVKGQLGAGPGSTSLEAPGSVAIDDEGALWVADTGNHRIVTF